MNDQTPQTTESESVTVEQVLARAHAAHRRRVIGILAECRCGDWSNVTESDTHAAHVAARQVAALRAAGVAWSEGGGS